MKYNNHKTYGHDYFMSHQALLKEWSRLWFQNSNRKIYDINWEHWINLVQSVNNGYNNVTFDSQLSVIE
jgi:hypothetical protein